MKMQSMEDLMVTGLTYVLDFEQQIAIAAPKMGEAASDPELKQTFQKTAQKSKEYARRVQQTFEKLGRPGKPSDNHIAKAMLAEVQQMIENTDPGPVRDAALIVAANQQQQYRVASYGSLQHYAEIIGKPDAAHGLRENLEESKGGDQKFKVNRQAKAA
jgi:ferritin-like metal-binding protein YciE